MKLPNPIVRLEGITLEKLPDGCFKIPGPHFTIGHLAYIQQHYDIQHIVIRKRTQENG